MDSYTTERLRILTAALTTRAGLDLDLPVTVRAMRWAAAFDAGGMRRRSPGTLIVHEEIAEQWPQDALAGLVAHQLGHVALGYVHDGFILHAVRFVLPWAAAASALWGALTSQPWTLVAAAGFFLAEQFVSWVLRRRVFAADRFAVDLVGAAPVRSMLRLLDTAGGVRGVIVRHLASSTHPTYEQRLRARPVRSRA
ncbi:M48 family metalloprotease [Planomonospora corallina]|uniref:M48 family metalloprotease n=1 Tax=Planomonospora corallina TaxID=1806052 RepID=A0ABV8IGM7_9ACTN